MTNEVDLTKEQVERFNARLDHLRGYYAPYLEAFGVRGYEYGVMAVKSLLTLNGGSIVALPAIAGVSKSEGVLPALYWAAGGYVIGLILAIAVTYLVHLNFMHLYSLFESQMRKQQLEAEKQILGFVRAGEEEIVTVGREISKREWVVWLTFWGPHIFGIASLTTFVCASFQVLKVFAQ